MKKLLAILGLLALAACEAAPAPQVLPPISFSDKIPFRLAVSEIRVVENYRAPLAAPNIDHQFPTPPTVALKTWASQRLQAAGGQGVLEFSIEDASVIENKLPRTEGLRGFFTDDQSERYDGKIRVVMRIYDGTRAAARVEGDVNALRSASINEKATVAEREKMYYDITKDLMAQFDHEAENRLRQYFGQFLR